MLESLELTDVTLVGLGFGGFIAAELATLNEDRLKALVLVGAAGTGPYSGYVDATGALNSGPSTGISRPSATVFISICTCSPYPPELPIEKTRHSKCGRSAVTSTVSKALVKCARINCADCFFEGPVEDFANPRGNGDRG